MLPRDMMLRKLPSAPAGGLAQGDIIRVPLTTTGDPNESDRFCWHVSELGASLALDWADDDGPTPLVGPALTATGAPAAGKLTPWLSCKTGTVLATFMAEASNYASATSVDPVAADDYVFAVLARIVATAGNGTLLATTSGAGGFQVFHNSGATAIGWLSDDGGSSVQSAGVLPSLGWCLVAGTYDDSGNQVLYVNGVAVDSDNVSALGVIGSGVGVGIGARPASDFKMGGDVARAMYWKGVGIAATADADWHNHLASSVLGYHNTTGNGHMSFVGAGIRTFVECDTGGVHVLGQNCCPAGNVGGREPTDGGTNKCFQNFAYEAGDEGLFTTSAGITSGTIDQSASMETNDAREVGPLAIRMVSPGVQRLLRYGDVTGNTNKHWVSVRCRVIAGTPELGLWDGTTFTKAGDLTQTDWTAKSYSVTPANASQQWAINLPAGSTIYFVMAQLTEGPVPVPEIANIANAAAATEAEGLLKFPATLSFATAGTLEMTIEPHGWDSGDLGTVQRIVDRATTSTDVMYIDDSVSPAKLESDDGTNTASATIVEVDETEKKIMTAWGAALTAQQEGQASNSAAFDGGLTGSGQIQIGATGYRSIKNIVLHPDYHKDIGEL